MQGLTEVLFRRVYNECFPGAIEWAVSPFLSLTHNIENAHGGIRQSLLYDVLPERNIGSIPVIPQILGKEPEEFISLANRLYELGYGEVNWNIGCPVRRIAAKHRGSGILPYPREVQSILDAVVPNIKPSLSVKMRIGLKEKDEITRLVPVLNEYPLGSVTIHPRLGRQGYGGHPDMETFGRVLPLLRHPVVYNGDIVTASDAARIRQLFPQISDIMIGRGVLYNPSLPLQIDSQCREDSELVALNTRFILRLLEEIIASYPSDPQRTNKTKEYWAMLWKSLPISEMQARTVLREEKLTAVEKMIRSFLQ